MTVGKNIRSSAVEERFQTIEPILSSLVVENLIVLDIAHPCRRECWLGRKNDRAYLGKTTHGGCDRCYRMLLT